MYNNFEQITVVHDLSMACALINKYDFKISGVFKYGEHGFKSTCFASSELLSNAIKEYEAGKLVLPVKDFMERYEYLTAEFNQVCHEF